MESRAAKQISPHYFCATGFREIPIVTFFLSVLRSRRRLISNSSRFYRAAKRQKAEAETYLRSAKLDEKHFPRGVLQHERKVSAKLWSSYPRGEKERDSDVRIRRGKGPRDMRACTASPAKKTKTLGACNESYGRVNGEINFGNGERSLIPGRFQRQREQLHESFLIHCPVKT
ncbi:hypothetical protein K0M31_002494 [Melipona bicolor]|uniref:Uncharacterized protein n=1 Tax=Melipona bicolor TaxID=60889 RepID=A0AA40KYX2_9HYME|nr:hypothetical protein K0M31_002494 [Melipona bicolor]